MIVQVAGHKVAVALEKIIKREDKLRLTHGHTATEEILLTANRMLSALTSPLNQFNLTHNTVYLDDREFEFVQRYSSDE